MAAGKQPNRRLAALVAEAGVSNNGLALRIRRLAQDAGADISPDHVSVRRWLDGVEPRERTARFIAAALGAKLGRRVTLADIGLGVRSSTQESVLVEDAATYPEQLDPALRTLGALSDLDLQDGEAVTRSRWSPTAVPGVVTAYLFGHGGAGGAPVADAATADAILATASHLMDLNFQLGGGHTRGLLLFYFRSEVLPLLEQRRSGLRRRAVFSAAAEVVQLLGWSAYDAGRQGAAQRYFVQALRLAREADDRMLGGRLLGNMSHQANYLGQPELALQLARAAQSASAGAATGTVEANLVAMEARALASAGDARGCADALRRAEAAFARGFAVPGPAWISYFTAEELAGEAAHCFRDLHRPREARTFSAEAVSVTGTPPRTRAFIGMVDAAAALADGEVDEALSLADAAVNAAVGLRSMRYRRYVDDFCVELEGRYAAHGPAQVFVRKARTAAS